MVAVVYDIIIEQGATFKLHLNWLSEPDVPMPLENFIARMQARPGFQSDVVWMDATTENDMITLDPATGRISVVVPAEVTAAIGAERSGVYDLELERTTDGYVKRLVEGIAIIRPEVTR